MSDSVSLSNNDLLVSENVSILFDRLYPHLRSILGKGYRDSLEILKEYIPFETEVYKSAGADRTGNAEGYIFPYL